MLLDRGAPVDCVDVRKWTAIMYAAQYGYEAIVESLLDSGSNYINADCNLPSPLQLAARNGFTTLVSLSGSPHLLLSAPNLTSPSLLALFSFIASCKN